MDMHKAALQIMCATLLTAAAALPPALANAAPAAQPAISMSRARAIALRVYPGGKIANEELEKEGGGSGLRYAFDVKKGATVYEVGVDAMTGKVLEKSTESPKDEAVERATESRERD